MPANDADANPLPHKGEARDDANTRYVGVPFPQRSVPYDPSFYKTVMGQRFYEGTIPAINRNLAKIAEQLERIADTLEKETYEPK